jgi:hypothetical protein
MAHTVSTIVPSVAVYGGARIVDNVYKGDGATAFTKGDLIRINTSGQIVNAATNSDTTGAVHGMVLATDATYFETTEYVPVLLFAVGTVIRMQCYDAAPSSLAIGTKYELNDGGTGFWSVTSTSTKGIAEVVDLPANEYPAASANDLTTYGVCYVKFAQAILDGHGA